MTDETAAVPLERARHRVDVVGRGHHDHGRGSLGYLTTQFVEERAAQMRRASFLGDAADETASDQPHREPRRAGEQTDRRAGDGPLGSLLADELQLVVGVDVAAGERSRTTIRSRR